MPPPPRAISASEDASPAAPQSWSETTRSRSTSSRLDSISFLPVNGSPIWTDGRLSASSSPELLAGEHAGAADAVAAGRRAVEEDDVPGPARLRLEHALGGQEPDAHRVHEAVVRVGRVEDRLAADRRHADAVPVVPDSGHGPLEHPARLAEAEPVEERHRPRTHGDDVAQDPADPGRGALERLDRGRMVVALDLERDRLAVAEIDDARVLARALEHARRVGREALQEQRRVLVAAVL